MEWHGDAGARRRHRELAQHLVGVRRTLRRILREAARDEPRERRRNVGPQLLDGARGLGHVRRHQLVRRQAMEGRMAGEQLVRHAAERVQIGAIVGRRIARRLLRGHVRRRADGGAELRQRRPDRPLLRGGDRLGDPEVGDDGRSSGEQDVVGLDVAVDDASIVRVGERLGNVAQDVDRRVDLDGPVREPGAQTLAVHERHRVVRQPLEIARGDDRDDVRLLKRRRELDLPLEPLGRHGGGELRGEHLDDDPSPEAALEGHEDAGHATAAELPLYCMRARERFLDLLLELHVHRRRRGVLRRGGKHAARGGGSPEQC